MLSLLGINGYPTDEKFFQIDKIYAHQKGYAFVNLAHSAPQKSSYSSSDALGDRITALENKLDTLVSQNNQKTAQPHGREFFARQQPDYYNRENKLCYYHARFGHKAVKCSAPCECAKFLTSKFKLVGGTVPLTDGSSSLYIIISVAGTDVRALIDSGSSISILPPHYFLNCELKPPPTIVAIGWLGSTSSRTCNA